MVFNTDTLQLKMSYRITTNTANAAIKSIEFSRRGSAFLINSQDRTIRVYNRETAVSCGEGCEPEPVQKLQVLQRKVG